MKNSNTFRKNSLFKEDQYYSENENQKNLNNLKKLKTSFFSSDNINATQSVIVNSPILNNEVNDKTNNKNVLTEIEDIHSEIPYSVESSDNELNISSDNITIFKGN